MLKPLKYLAAIMLSLFSVNLLAIPVNSLTGNGIVWTLNVDSMFENTASFSLYADVSGSTLGDAYLHEFGLKNFGSGASISNLAATAGTWDWKNEAVNAWGCGGNGTYDALCIYNTGYYKDAPSTASDFMFTFDVTLDAGDLFPELMNFKVRWVEEKHKGHHSGDYYAKVGDLISEDFYLAPVSPPGPGPGPGPTPVPEPAILGLMVIGLLTIFAVRRLQARA